MRFADIAVNLTDPMFQGEYHGKSKHTSDLEAILGRAKARGVDRILITGTSLEESRKALDMAKKYDLHCTAGIHPTSTSVIDVHLDGPESYFKQLVDLIEDDRSPSGSKRIISIGEIGLDYDRLHHSPKETQLKHLPYLLSLATTFKLPLFLHSRHPEAHIDLVRILKEAGWGSKGEFFYGGVVHSFTGTVEEMKELVDMGLHIGINGCSLKTEENLDVVRHLPVESLLLETDAPWCTPSPSHASSTHLPSANSYTPIPRVSKPQSFTTDHGVKGRMEPAEVVLIAHIVASIKGLPVEQVADAAWRNTLRLFYPHEV